METWFDWWLAEPDVIRSFKTTILGGVQLLTFWPNEFIAPYLHNMTIGENTCKVSFHFIFCEWNLICPSLKPSAGLRFEIEHNTVELNFVPITYPFRVITDKRRSNGSSNGSSNGCLANQENSLSWMQVSVQCMTVLKYLYLSTILEYFWWVLIESTLLTESTLKIRLWNFQNFCAALRGTRVPWVHINEQGGVKLLFLQS